MENNSLEIYAPMNNRISLKIIPGHFATSFSHVNFYLDMTTMKTCHTMADEVAKELARQYLHNLNVDTIICMDGCEMIGGFLAQNLTNVGMLNLNARKSIYVISPEISTRGKLVFRENFGQALNGKNILLLVASTTTGNTIHKSFECIEYYGGKIQAISALFSAVDEIDQVPVHTIFSANDLPEYQSYEINQCPFCLANQRLEAIINVYGYMKI